MKETPSIGSVSGDEEVSGDDSEAEGGEAGQGEDGGGEVVVIGGTGTGLSWQGNCWVSTGQTKRMRKLMDE